MLSSLRAVVGYLIIFIYKDAILIIKNCNLSKRKLNKYYFLKDCVIGVTNNTGCDFYIDYINYHKVCQYTWYEDGQGYIRANINNKNIRLHTYIIGDIKQNQCIDHINHIKSDNRICNLRVVTNSQNQMNRGKTITNTSGVKGVFWHKLKKKWQANLQINKKLLYLGIYKDKQEAIQARIKAEQKYFKKYNFHS